MIIITDELAEPFIVRGVLPQSEFVFRFFIAALISGALEFWFWASDQPMRFYPSHRV
jgi:hypothetical protein